MSSVAHFSYFYLLIMLCNNIAEIEELWLSRIEIAMGHVFHKEFFIITKWIAEMLFMLFLLILLCNA